MNLKIGILTFWGVPNYGAFAQAYALNKVVKYLIKDANVYHIAWLHPKHTKLYFEKKAPKCNSLMQLVNPWFYYNYFKYLFNKRIEYPAFANDWAVIPHLNINTENALENVEWDIIITGSDAIWEYSIKAFGDDIHLIGNNLNCKKLYSYAASFGEMNINDEFPSFITEGLKKYDEISVRDAVSQNIIKNLVGKDAQLVIDPTLLYDFKNDSNIPVPKYKKYILVYGTNFTSNIIEDVKKYALQHNLLIIGAGLTPEWCDEKLTDIGPLEWIGMFKEAELIVTCTFHGLMFSINYNKMVLFNQIAYTVNRSKWLIEQLGLSDLYKNVTLDKVLNYSWDYSVINQRLDELRAYSLNFLKKVLKNE